MTCEDIVKIEECEKQLWDLQRKEEIFLRQRSKSLWLKARDKNTNFFHAAASNRRRNNRISRIVDENNKWHEKEEDIAEVFVDYFNNVFSTSNPTMMDQVLTVVDPKVSAEDNEKLLADFKPEEIKEALDQMNPDKAP